MAGFRHTIKVKLTSGAESDHAAQIVEYWRQRRELAKHITRAIRVYYGLLQGDTTLLEEYFPFLAVGRSGAAAPRPFKPTSTPTITRVEKSADDDAADLLESLGI